MYELVLLVETTDEASIAELKNKIILKFKKKEDFFKYSNLIYIFEKIFMPYILRDVSNDFCLSSVYLNPVTKKELYKEINFFNNLISKQLKSMFQHYFKYCMIERSIESKVFHQFKLPVLKDSYLKCYSLACNTEDYYDETIETVLNDIGLFIGCSPINANEVMLGFESLDEDRSEYYGVAFTDITTDYNKGYEKVKKISREVLEDNYILANDIQIIHARW